MFKQKRWYGLLLGLMTMLACSLPVQIASQPAATQAADGGVDYQATIESQQATQIALSVQATILAQQNAQPQAATSAEQATSLPPTAAPTSTPALPDFETWMKSAHILVYTDMSGSIDRVPYVPDALDGLGLSYTYTKDALGDFKNDLLAGAPNGQPWDLIISAKELHTALSGEFYDYLDDALAHGSAVIIEDWSVDSIWQGEISRLFTRCGVEFQQDWPKASLEDQVLYVINGQHPIHHMPHEGIRLSNPTGYWDYGLGDFIRLKPGSNAQLLWGTLPNVSDSHGVAAVCVDGRLIIQTYCTHSYGYDRVMPMWQNYIYNALKARYEYLQAQQ